MTDVWGPGDNEGGEQAGDNDEAGDQELAKVSGQDQWPGGLFDC